MLSYQFLTNDVVVDTYSSGKWVRLLSNSGVFTYKCLAKNTVGTTISENEKNITVAGNYYTAFCGMSCTGVYFRATKFRSRCRNISEI